MNIILKTKGFTLIELLVVIGIIAILATATILVLNPGELLKRARDINRINDINTLGKAVNIAAARVGGTGGTVGWACGVAKCFTSMTGTTVESSAGKCGGRFATAGLVGQSTSAGKAINGTGWMPFTSLTTTDGLTQLPLDPSNAASAGVYAGSFYAYACDGLGGFEVNAAMESFDNSGVGKTADKDGGDSNSLYERGTKLTM